jgi:hypothetical protein
MRRQTLFVATIVGFFLVSANGQAAEEPLVLCIVAAGGEVGTCVPTANLPEEKRKLGPIAGPDGQRAGEIVPGTLDLVADAEKNLPASRARCVEESGNEASCDGIFSRAAADIGAARQVLESASR